MTAIVQPNEYWICSDCRLGNTNNENENVDENVGHPINENGGPPYHVNNPLLNVIEVVCYVCLEMALKPWDRKIQCYNSICGQTFHLQCVSLPDFPDYKWYCQSCRDGNSFRKKT